MGVQIAISGSVASEFRHFWCVVVRGFDANKHCLPCLIGTRIRQVKPAMVESGDAVIDVKCKSTEFVYVCGVSYTWKHSENFHLVGSPQEDAVASCKTFRGVDVEIHGATRIQIDAAPAKLLYPHLDSSYLTCRNFQFGAQVYGKSKSGGKILSRQPQLF